MHNFGIGTVGTKEEAELLEQNHYKVRKTIHDGMATHFLACSKEAAEWGYGDIISKEKIYVLNNGIDLEKYCFNEEARKQVRTKLHVEDKFVIGNIGRFVYQKNHDFLIDVFYKVSKVLENAVLVLIGVGELQQEIEDKIRVLGIENKVIFLGKRNDVEMLMQGMDVFALPSRFDGFPLSLIEAQAATLPCIVGNVPDDAIMGERTKKVEFDVQQWVDFIVREYALNSRNIIYKDILEKHSINTWIHELETIYTS